MSDKVQITIKNKVGEKYADLQTKIVTPSKETQVITADEGYYGLREVIVSPPTVDGDSLLEAINSIKNNVDEVKSDIENSVNNINANIDGAKNNIENSVKTNLDNAETNINLNILNAETSINNKISSVETSINSNIDETEKTIINSIANSLDMKNVVLKVAEESKKWDLCEHLFSSYVFNESLEALADLGYEVEFIKPYDQYGELFRSPVSMFVGNYKITKLPKLIFNVYCNNGNRNIQSGSVFNGCNALKEVDVTFRTNQCSYSLESIFSNCTSLKKVTMKFRDNSEVYNWNNAFYNCTALETIDGTIRIKNKFSIDGTPTANNMFYNCYKLTNVTFGVIYANIKIGSGSTYGHLLTIDSLLSACRAMISGKTLTVGTANLEKLATVYVDSTGYQVDSSTEGAITVAQYMANKSCSLA